MSMISGIYKIENIVNGRVYIGQSADLRHRHSRHFSDLRYAKHKNQYLQRAWNKYGENNFVFSIILYCEQFELTRYEQAILDSVSNVYNLCLECVDSQKGVKRTEEQNQRNRETHTGKTATDVTKKKLSQRFSGKNNPNFRRNFSPEHRRKIGEACKGRILSDDRILSREITKATNSAILRAIKFFGSAAIAA